MFKELQSIDISNKADLLRLAEDVRQSNQPRVLRRDNEDIAVLVPMDHVANNEADDSNGTHERTPHERTPHERTPHERTPHERTAHERTPHERTPHERTPHERQDVDTDTLIATFYKEKMHGAQIPSTIATLRGAAGSLGRPLSKEDMRDIAQEDVMIVAAMQLDKSASLYSYDRGFDRIAGLTRQEP